MMRENKKKIGDTRLTSKPEGWEKNAQATRQAWRAAYEGRFDDAETHFTQAIKLRPDDVSAILTRGDFHFSRGNDLEAITDFRRALEINPNSERALQSLAALLAKSNQDPLRNGIEALKYAQQAFDGRVTKNSTVYATLAAAEAECGHFEKAVHLLKVAIEFDPKNDDLLRILARFEDGKPFYFKKRPEEDKSVEE
jgi:tetratricopeptide (TPR) repeat protein